MSAQTSQVPDQIRASIEALPVIAEALEQCIAVFADAYRQAMVTAGADYGGHEEDAVADELIERCGAEDLRQMLSVVADRLHEHGIGGNPLPSRGVSREDAAARLAAIAARYR